MNIYVPLIKINSVSNVLGEVFMEKDFETIHYDVIYITDRKTDKELMSHYIDKFSVNIYFLYLEKFDFENLYNLIKDYRLNLSAILIDINFNKKDDIKSMNIIIEELETSSVMILRNKNSNIPVMEFVIDDFLVPPYSPEELLWRVVKAIQRQRNITYQSSSQISFGKYLLHLETRELTSSNINRILTDGEHTLLLHLIGKKGKFSSREELSIALGKKRHPMSSRSIDMLIGRLRRKIDDNPRMPQYIVTSRGKGYMLVGEPK